MKTNPLLKLSEYGQSVWLDNLHRRLVTDGELESLIANDGVRGVTSNPSIFKKAIAGSDAYDEAVSELARAGMTTPQIYQRLTVEDVQSAADLFRPLYDRSEGGQGFVSLEVNPHLARDTEGTVAEARQLWAALDRPNVFIKVPATVEGLPAIRTLIAEGISVNVTLLFSLDRYREVALAYCQGLRDRAAKALPVNRVASVASFFLSRIDSLVDKELDRLTEKHGNVAADLRGKVAVASARKAYGMYQELFSGEAFGDLSVLGARPQRLLWASTSTKDPAYPDVKYVEALIGPETVNTMPGATLEAYRDHGDPEPRLTDPGKRYDLVLAGLAGLDINLDRITSQLVREGIEKFNQPFDDLMSSLERRRTAAQFGPTNRLSVELGQHRGPVDEGREELETRRALPRIWAKDSSLWEEGPLVDTDDLEDSLGWLELVENMAEKVNEIEEFAAEVKADGITHVVLVGMGGSSMTALALTGFLPRGEGAPELTVLDTTDPGNYIRILDTVPLETTLFILASKSGTTAETRALGDLFLDRVRTELPADPGRHFAAITDPDTPLAEMAAEEGFRAIFLNPIDIGGRYSALSYFGLVPAALHGIDVGDLLRRAKPMVQACQDGPVPTATPGLELGAILGGLGRHGRNKITLVTPPDLASFGLWLEQLLAESTGKMGKGLVPVAGEPLGPPEVYGNDRLFVRFVRTGHDEDEVDDALKALTEAGHPVITIELEEDADLVQEFFRWEFATAVAGALLEINPFNQPNVQESKDNTRRLLESGNDLDSPESCPTTDDSPLCFFTVDGAGCADSEGELMRRFLGAVGPGNYLTLAAFLPTDDSSLDLSLGGLRLLLRDRLHTTTTLGYGPRYLHSTGQLHKGGPDGGIFLLLTANSGQGPRLPGKRHTLGELQHAQALGEFQALQGCGRRVLRVDLGSDPATGLNALRDLVTNEIPGFLAKEESA